MQLIIVLEYAVVHLGIEGTEALFKAFNTNELNTLNKIDGHFLEKINAMFTGPVGFTCEAKEKLWNILYRETGQYCFIAEQYYKDGQAEQQIKILKNLVRLCNCGMSLLQALQVAHIKIN